jgi:hypothetical protein
MRFFVLNRFGQKNPSELKINHLKYFRFLSSNLPKYSNFIAFPVLSIHAKFHSAYYPYTVNFIPRIISMLTISFRVLSANAKFFLRSNTNSAYSNYALNFIPRILSIR